MAEYEPDDSRDVTNTQNRAPGEPPRTGPREGRARAEAGQQAEQSEARQAEAAEGRATEGDSPAHPDRFSGGSAQEYAEESEGEESDRQEIGDRWSDKADDSEDYVPEGK
jgi:hypothetical protein